MNPLQKIVLLTFLIPIFSCSSSQKKWNEMANRFLIPLTFPDSEWSAEDFGTQTTEEEKTLLQKFLPKIYLSEGSLVPIDFYQEYLPNSVLKNYRGKIIAKKISRTRLKAAERTAGYHLDYQGEFKKCNLPQCAKKVRVIYGRVFYENMLPPKKYQNEEKFLLLF